MDSPNTNKISVTESKPKHSSIRQKNTKKNKGTIPTNHLPRLIYSSDTLFPFPGKERKKEMVFNHSLSVRCPTLHLRCPTNTEIRRKLDNPFWLTTTQKKIFSLFIYFLLFLRVLMNECILTVGHSLCSDVWMRALWRLGHAFTVRCSKERKVRFIKNQWYFFFPFFLFFFFPFAFLWSSFRRGCFFCESICTLRYLWWTSISAKSFVCFGLGEGMIFFVWECAFFSALWRGKFKIRLYISLNARGSVVS